MKKALIIVGVILVLLISAMIAIPYLFRDQIIQFVKDDANKNIIATLDFDDMELSFFRQFPRLTLTLDRPRLINLAPFAGDTLLSLQQFHATINLGSLWGDEGLEVNSVILDHPRVLLKALKDGSVNWDIARPAPLGQPADSAATSGGVNVALQQYAITGGLLRYSDEASGQQVELRGLNHEGSGDFRQSQFTLATRTDIENILVQSGAVTYLNHAAMTAKIDLDIDSEQSSVRLKENEIRLNRLGLNFDGSIAQEGENTRINLSFDAPEADFKDVLSMIPYIYQKDFEQLKAAGKINLKGVVNGLYSENQVPAFDIAFAVKDGNFQYTDLPTPVEQVQLDLQLENPGKTADHTVIHLKNLHLEILNEPLDARALVTHPASDPLLDLSLKGRLSLDQIKNVFPLQEGVDISGKAVTDFQLKGRMSAIEQNQVDRFSTGGTLAFSNVAYAAPDLPEKVNIRSANLAFSPQKASLSNFSAVIGKSDLQAAGILENIFGYLFHDQSIKGTLNLQSNFFDLNPWLAGESEPLTAVELPGNIEFLLAADMKKVLFDNLTLNNVKSNLLLRDKKLNLTSLEANLLGGQLQTSGSYVYLPPKKPEIFFDARIAQFNIPDLFQNFLTVRQFAPIAGNLNGIMNGQLSFNTEVDEKNLMPNWQKFFSQGNLQIPKANLNDAAPFNKLAETLKINELHNPALNNLNPKYTIKDGRFHLQPMTFTVDQYQIYATGSNGIDKSLDYTMKVQVPAAKLNQSANAAISKLLKQDLNPLTDEAVIIDVKITGLYDKPQIATSFSDVVKKATDPLKVAAQQEAEKQKALLEKQAEEALAKQKAELEKQKKESEDKLKDKLKDLLKKKK